MRIQKVRTQTLLAIAFLLIGGFALGGIVLPTAMGNVSFDFSGPYSNLNWDPGADWDDADASPSCYAMADYLDDDGNVIGTFSVSGSRSPTGNEVVYSASASVYGADGMANAWVSVPKKNPQHDQGGRGDAPVSWNDPNLPDGMTASDTNTLPKNGVGGRTMIASAALSANGARVRIKFTASGI